MKFWCAPQQYDYDSSSLRTRLSHEALLAVTLPFLKKKLDPAYKRVSPHAKGGSCHHGDSPAP